MFWRDFCLSIFALDLHGFYRSIGGNIWREEWLGIHAWKWEQEGEGEREGGIMGGKLGFCPFFHFFFI